MSRLRKAAEAWVRAEWHFRCGPNAFQEREAVWYCDATDELRQVLTGEIDLDVAAKSLGVRIKPERKRLKLSNTKPPMQRKRLKTRHLGLFDNLT